MWSESQLDEIRDEEFYFDLTGTSAGEIIEKRIFIQINEPPCSCCERVLAYCAGSNLRNVRCKLFTWKK